MPALFRWTAVNAIDKDAFKRGDLEYSRMGNVKVHNKSVKQKIPSDKAFWVFDLGQAYRPAEGVIKGCVLLKISLVQRDFGILTGNGNPLNASGDTQETFSGEAMHPDRVLVKSNEVGAYGIGVDVLRQVHPQSIALASEDEVRNALEKGKKDAIPDWYKQAVKNW